MKVKKYLLAIATAFFSTIICAAQDYSSSYPGWSVNAFPDMAQTGAPVGLMYKNKKWVAIDEGINLGDENTESIRIDTANKKIYLALDLTLMKPKDLMPSVDYKLCSVGLSGDSRVKDGKVIYSLCTSKFRAATYSLGLAIGDAITSPLQLLTLSKMVPSKVAKDELLLAAIESGAILKVIEGESNGIPLQSDLDEYARALGISDPRVTGVIQKRRDEIRRQEYKRDFELSISIEQLADFEKKYANYDPDLLLAVAGAKKSELIRKKHEAWMEKYAADFKALSKHDDWISFQLTYKDEDPNGYAAISQRLIKAYYEQGESEAERFSVLKAAVDAGNLWSITSLAKAYETGRGTEINYSVAKSLYEAADAEGISSGATGLGRIFSQGLGVTADMNRGVEWYKKAAAAGDVDAKLALGKAYLKGTGLSIDYGVAQQYLEEASDSGEAEASALLGGMYADGHIGGINLQAALWQYQKASAGGINVEKEIAAVTSKIEKLEAAERKKIEQEVARQKAEQNELARRAKLHPLYILADRYAKAFEGYSYTCKMFAPGIRSIGLIHASNLERAKIYSGQQFDIAAMSIERSADRYMDRCIR